MATAADSDFNETEDFDDYNPHPYQGGYDIAFTYGNPLPPSSKTCYPLHEAAPAASPQRPAAAAFEEPEPEKSPTGGGVRSASGDYWAHDWDFGLSYCPSERGDWKSGRRGCNDPLLWTADYLFGYLPMYGEKRHESHHYGNLNYAYEKHLPQRPLSVAVEPDTPSPWQLACLDTTDSQVEYYDYEGRGLEVPHLVDVEQCWYGNHGFRVAGENQHESHLSESVNYAYDRQSHQEPTSVVVDPDVPPSWLPSKYSHLQAENYGYEGLRFEDPCHDYVEQHWYGDHEFPVSGKNWRGSDLSENANYTYDRHSNLNPISIVVEPDVTSSWEGEIAASSQYQSENVYETNWFTELISPKMEHYLPLRSGVYGEDVYSQSEHKPVYGSHGSEQPISAQAMVSEDLWPYGVNCQGSILDQLFGQPGTHNGYYS